MNGLQQNKEAVGSSLTLLQYCRLVGGVGGNSRDISRDIWNLSRYFKPFVYSTVSRGTVIGKQCCEVMSCQYGLESNFYIFGLLLFIWQVPHHLRCVRTSTINALGERVWLHVCLPFFSAVLCMLKGWSPIQGVLHIWTPPAEMTENRLKRTSTVLFKTWAK